MTEPRHDRAEPATFAEPTSVLVLESGLDTGPGGARRRLVAPAVRQDSRLVCVGTGSPREVFHQWVARGGDPPADTTVVSLGEEMRGATSTDTVTTGPVRIKPVHHPGNLTELGVTITDTVTEWDGSSGVVCFDALTTLLQYAELETLYQFLHVLVARLEAAGVVSFHRLDATAHDEQTIATLRQLFDSIARIDGEKVSIEERSV